MIEMTNLPNQQEILPQPPRFFKPLIWKINLIHLLIVNVIFFLLAVGEMSGFKVGAGFGIFSFVSALAIIDFIAVFFYIIQKQPRGIARVIWDALLIILGFVAFYYGVFAFLFR